MPDEAAARDRHLFAPGPKRILALDGGGTLGIVSLGFLARMEALLRDRHGGDPAFRLCDYFDLIGGTSTGAIIAAGLALGRSVAELTDLYMALGPRVFRPRRLPLPWLRPRFDHAALAAVLKEQIGDHRLDSDALRTGFALMLKRLDTGSPWLLSNNPRSPFWNDPADGAYHGNRGYHLATLVRASAAAPFYFAPEAMRIAPDGPPALFVDGGVSPWNTPALPLLMLATIGAYGLRWEAGADRLLLVSVGTGLTRPRMSVAEGLALPAAGLAVKALAGMIADTQRASLMLLQWLSDGPDPWTVNAEIGDLRGETLGGRALLSFQRYDMPFEREVFAAMPGRDWDAARLARLARFDAPENMPELRALSAEAAARQLRDAHFPAAFDLPG